MHHDILTISNPVPLCHFIRYGSPFHWQQRPSALVNRMVARPSLTDPEALTYEDGQLPLRRSVLERISSSAFNLVGAQSLCIR